MIKELVFKYKTKIIFLKQNLTFTQTNNPNKISLKFSKNELKTINCL